MSTMPDIGALLAEAWGWGPEPPTLGWLAGFSNLVIGTNPPYTVTDFLQFYPGFGGNPISVTATATNGSAVLASVAQYSLLGAGQLISGPGVALGTIIVSIGGSLPDNVTISNPASIGGTLALKAYTAPFVPLPVLSAYTALASASLVQMRWQGTWSFAMALYIAHFATLYLRSDGDPASTPGMKAAAGLSAGITVSKSAGGVSQSLQVPGGLEDWGAWNTTGYGQQLATFARIMGSGPSMLF